jgi:hypothetical protein
MSEARSVRGARGFRYDPRPHGGSRRAVSNHGGLEHSTELYDELIRVPLIIRAPRFESRRLNAQAQLVDIYHTLLAMIGGQITRGIHGRDLTDMLRDPHEQQNVASRHRLEAARLEQQLNRMIRASVCNPRPAAPRPPGTCALAPAPRSAGCAQDRGAPTRAASATG